jgi:hypothetical protein
MGDVAFVFGKDERGLHILRRRSEDAPVETGVMEPLAEGRPITGEVISLKQREDTPFLFDVKTVLEAQETANASTTDTKPARVATDSYRKGWDAIWGGRRSSSRDVN